MGTIKFHDKSKAEDGFSELADKMKELGGKKPYVHWCVIKEDIGEDKNRVRGFLNVHGISDAEVIGFLEHAKSQILRDMKSE